MGRDITSFSSSQSLFSLRSISSTELGQYFFINLEKALSSRSSFSTPLASIKTHKMRIFMRFIPERNPAQKKRRQFCHHIKGRSSSPKSTAALFLFPKWNMKTAMLATFTSDVVIVVRSATEKPLFLSISLTKKGDKKDRPELFSPVPFGVSSYLPTRFFRYHINFFVIFRG